MIQQVHAQASSDYGEPHPQAAREFQQFAFLIGDHEVALHAWTGDAWTPPRPVSAN